MGNITHADYKGGDGPKAVDKTKADDDNNVLFAAPLEGSCSPKLVPSSPTYWRISLNGSMAVWQHASRSIWNRSQNEPCELLSVCFSVLSQDVSQLNCLSVKPFLSQKSCLCIMLSLCQIVQIQAVFQASCLLLMLFLSQKE